MKKTINRFRLRSFIEASRPGRLVSFEGENTPWHINESLYVEDSSSGRRRPRGFRFIVEPCPTTWTEEDEPLRPMIFIIFWKNIIALNEESGGHFDIKFKGFKSKNDVARAIFC